MADEVTDSSNKEQFVVCLHWVDHDLVTHEELVGLYAVDNTKALYLEWVCSRLPKTML